MEPKWTPLATHWELRIGKAMISLEPRPHYCDRGHWIGKVFNLPGINAHDGFPRYYMDAERGKLELKEWLIWRLECISRLPHPPID